jgi:hypothetical protein
VRHGQHVAHDVFEPTIGNFSQAGWQAWRELLRRLEYIAFFREFLVGIA